MRIDEAFDYLKTSFEGERLAHAYIVEGPTDGAGRELAEKALCLLFCQSSARPCGACPACEKVRSHTHPDFFWIESQKKSRRISIEQIRGLRSFVFQTSFLGGWKACVLKDADRLGTEASNAFLKMLEEPPAKSIFFLLTEAPHFLLPTVKSRCLRLVVSGNPRRLREEWRRPLLDILSASGETGEIAALGRAARVMKILEDMKAIARADEEKTAEEAQREDDDNTLDARVESRYRGMRTTLVRSILEWYHDVFRIVCGGDEALVWNGDCVDDLVAAARRLDYSQAAGNIRVVLAMNEQLERSIPDGAVLAAGLGQLK